MNSERIKILFVEDDRVDRMAFERFVAGERLPYDCAFAASVFEASQALASGKFDVAIIDYRLGDGTAFDLFSPLGAIPCIMVTGSGEEEIAVRAMKSGAFDYLVKDADRAYLLTLPKTVENAIRRSRTDKALRESEEKFRVLAEKSPNMIFINKRGRVVYANEKCEEIMGYTREEFLSHDFNFLTLIAPESLELVGNAFGRQMNGEDVPPFEYAIMTKQGGKLDAIITTKLIDLGGEAAILGIITDITERKRMEKELKEFSGRLEVLVKERTQELEAANQLLNKTKDRLQFLVSESPAAIYTCKPSGDYGATFISDNIKKQLGYEPAEFMENSTFWADHIHPEDRQRVFDELGNLLETGHHSHEYRFLRKDGTYRWMHDEMRLVRDRQSASDQIIGSWIDITEIKQAEELQKVRTRLILFANSHSSDELLEETLNEVEKLTDSLIGFYHYVDPDQNSLTLQNWSTRTKKEFCKAEGKGSHYEIARAGVWVDCLRQRKPVIHNDYASLPHKKSLPPGHARVVRELVVPVMRGDKIMALLGIGNKPRNYDEQDIKIVSLFADLAWDIAEHKLAEEEIRNLNDDLKIRIAELEEARILAEAGIKARSSFLANISHELVTPLNSIIGFSQILLDGLGGPLNEQQKDYAASILQGGNRLHETLKEIVQFAGLESGEMKLQTDRFLCKDLLNASLLAFCEKAAVQGVALSLEIGLPPETEIEADRGKLQQAMFNLIDNAVKFTPKGGSVRVAARRVKRSELGVGSNKEVSERRTQDSELDADFIEISVADTGIGIQEEDLARLFQTFEQLESPYTKQYKGTGLGLMLAKKLIELHGGRIWVRSEIDKGSTFTFVIPVSQHAEGKGQARG